MSSAILGLGFWLARAPLAKLVIEGAFSSRGVNAEFQIVNLDFNSLTLTEIEIGQPDTPDISIERMEARWSWRGMMPELQSVRLVEPHVRVQLTPRGQMRVQALDQFEPGPPGARRPSLPAYAIEIVQGAATIEAPFGALEATLDGSGVLGETFQGAARIAPVDLQRGAYGFNGGAQAHISAENGDVVLQLNAEANALSWNGARIESATLAIEARTPRDLANFDVDAEWRAQRVLAQEIGATALTGRLQGEVSLRETTLAIAEWRSAFEAQAPRAAIGDTSLETARFDALLSGDAESTRGAWRLGADRFAGFGVIAGQASIDGRIAGHEGVISGDAVARLAQASLSASAQADLRARIPEASGSPLGPTLASAERALSAAADSFMMNAPISYVHSDAGLRISITAPWQLESRSGLIAKLTPLRVDTPALQMQAPPSGTANLLGAIALEVSGGGAPRATLLLDSLIWSEGGPLEGEGTLSLSDWRSGDAALEADEIGVSFALNGGGVGRAELRGPLHISGPLGEGRIDTLVASLNITTAWDLAGWRVTSNAGCLPMRAARIEAAGLAFTDGAFALCPREGPLIAADARANLSGGFAVQRLTLNGALAGPDGSPAVLRANSLTGRFGGQSSDLTLSLEATSPSLAIALTEDRDLTLSLRRLTALAHVAETWRVEGEFEYGVLEDPALPGSVSAIAGAWTAAPEAGAPVIRIGAGEALLVANRPDTDTERLLFNPLRLTDVDAQLRDGLVTANGRIVLDEDAQHLADFDARHDVSEAQGSARIDADELVFGPDLQPYDITERARGLVADVRGPAAIIADIAWTRDAITGIGRVNLDGVSLATSTIPVVNDVYGEIYFDDIFALTTPPGQRVRIGMLNPGVRVFNGRVQFQLLEDARVAIEEAEFDFAAGVLAMEPTSIVLGADETRFELRLRDIDASELLASLNIPDLAATGRVEGEFPLLLTRRTAYIENGALRAQEGGFIAYTGSAGDNATGAARIAFQALQNFRYDSLTLNLNGDISGEVVTDIEFQGRNAGRPINLGPLMPGLGEATVRGVPFEFNVTVTAPFRRLAQAAATFTDPTSLIERARETEEEPVDQPPLPN